MPTIFSKYPVSNLRLVARGTTSFSMLEHQPELLPVLPMVPSARCRYNTHTHIEHSITSMLKLYTYRTPKYIYCLTHRQHSIHSSIDYIPSNHLLLHLDSTNSQSIKHTTVHCMETSTLIERIGLVPSLYHD